MGDLLGKVANRLELVLHHFAEEEVQTLNSGRSFVEGVNLGVTDVLLQGVVLQVTRPAVGLKTHSKHFVGALRTDTLNNWKEQIIDPQCLVQINGRVTGFTHFDQVLPIRGVEH